MGEQKWEGLLPFQWGGFHEGRSGHGVGVGGLDLWFLVREEKKGGGYLFGILVRKRARRWG